MYTSSNRVSLPMTLSNLPMTNLWRIADAKFLRRDSLPVTQPTVSKHWRDVS